MIDDPQRIRLTVEADYGFRRADEATALGLIVTELAINALRHAFPDQRAGNICVRYRFDAGNWTLSVSDDGIGARRGTGRPGLGTSVIEVLSRQLGAESTVASTDTGTTASVASRRAAPTLARQATGGR